MSDFLDPQGPYKVFLAGNFVGNVDHVSEARELVYSVIAQYPPDKRTQNYKVVNKYGGMVGGGTTT